MIDTPVCASPAMIARSTGAAPRQRGSSDGWTLSIGCSVRNGSLSSAPNAHTTTASGPAALMRARASSSLTLSGWSTGIPSSRARTATGGGVSLRPRPAGRSGRVTTSEGRCAEAASRSRTAAANSLVPRKTVLTLSQRADGLLALIARCAVEDQDAVEMVDLVLDDARLQARGLDRDRLTVLVVRTDADVDRALDVDDHAGQRETALLHRLGRLAPPFDDRVDQGVDGALLLDAVDQHAVEHADLGGGQADADRVGHQPAHAADLLAQRVVEGFDRDRLGPQDGVAVLAD